MKNHESLRELRDLMKLPDQELRMYQLEDWLGRWLLEVKFEQAVVDTKYLSSEYNDVIKIKLAQNIAEELAENCATYSTSDRKISANLVALRRKSK